MKNNFNLLSSLKKSFLGICMIAAASALMFASCQNNDQKLLDALDEVNSTLPNEIVDGMSLESVSVEDGAWVTYTVLVNDELYDIFEMENQKGVTKSELIKDLKNGDPDVKSFLRLCKKLKLGIAYKYVGAYSMHTFTVYIGNDNF